MRYEHLGDLPPGSRASVRPHNKAFRLAARLARRSYSGGLEEGYGAVVGPADRRMDAKITSVIGGGKYAFARVQGRAGGAWAVDGSLSGTCWEYQKNATVTVGTFVNLIWQPHAAEYRFMLDKCV